MWKRALQTLFLCSLFLVGMPATAEVHCHCESLTCSGGTVPDIPDDAGYFPQQLPKNQAKCKDYCQTQLDQRIADWITNPANCRKTISCRGTSRVGTAKNTIAFSAAHTAAPCVVDPPSGNACCPDFAKGFSRDQLSSMFTIGNHQPGSPYQYSFNSNINTTNLAAYLNQWATWLRFDGCPTVVGFRLEIKVYETGVDASTAGAPLPSAPNGALLATQVVNMTPTPTPTTFAVNMASSPNWRRTRVSMIPVNAHGQPVQCSKVGGCDQGWTYAWRPTSISARVAGPQAGSSSTGQIAP